MSRSAADERLAGGERPWLAVAAWVLSKGLVIAGLVIWARPAFTAPAFIFMRGPAALLGLAVSLLVQATSGLILAFRRPRNRMGWLILAFTAVTCTSVPIIAASASPGAETDPIIRWLGWAASSVGFPAASFLAFALAFLFPDGHLLSRAWRPAISVVAAISLLVALVLAVQPGGLVFMPTIANPLAGGPGSQASLSGAALFLLAGCGAIAGWALVARYRVSDAIARAQMRWYIASGIVLSATNIALTVSVVVLDPAAPLGEAIETIDFLALGLPAIAITIAILRYRLYDIDTIISRAFVYGALTALLAGIYTASIRLFNALFVWLTGEDSDVALVLTTLLLATTFTPIKGRLEALADRRLRGVEDRAESAARGVPDGAALSSVVEDPAFVALVDARVSAALSARRSAGPRKARTGG